MNKYEIAIGHLKGLNTKNCEWIRRDVIKLAVEAVAEKAERELPKPTKLERQAIDFYRGCGFNWIFKNSKGDLKVSRKKPFKCNGFWAVLQYRKEEVEIVDLPSILKFGWLSREDEEPHYIGLA